MCNCLDSWWENDKVKTAPHVAEIVNLQTGAKVYDTVLIIEERKEDGSRPRSGGIPARYCPWCGEPWHPSLQPPAATTKEIAP